MHFGKLVGPEFNNAKEVAAYIDQEVLRGYQTFSTSSAALTLLGKPVSTELASETSNDRATAIRYMESRLELLNEQEQEKLLQMYANPLLRKQ